MFPIPLEFHLLSASKTGDLALVNDCLNAGANINHLKDDETALSLAIHYGHESVVKLLSDRGVDFEITHSYANNYLIYAALSGNNNKIVDLLQATGKLNFLSPSHEYAYKGDIANLQRVLSESPCADLENNTEVHYSAANGQLEALSLLVTLGFSVTAKNYKGQTALLIAASHGHLQVTEWLLKNGASLTENDNDGNTALLLAAWKGHLSVVEWLLQNGASLAEKNNIGNTALLRAALKGHLSLVEWLLKNGASLAEKRNNGDTALLQAAGNGHLALVDWLLHNGASLAEKDNEGNAALSLAIKGGHAPLIERLLARGTLIAQSLTFTKIATMLEICENCMDNKVVVGLKIDEKLVTREMPGFANAITTLDELSCNKELINRSTNDNYFLNLIVTCHQLLPTLDVSNKKLITLLKNKLMLLSGRGLQYASIFSFLKPALENKTEPAPSAVLKDEVVEKIPAELAVLIGQLYRSISLR